MIPSASQNFGMLLIMWVMMPTCAQLGTGLHLSMQSSITDSVRWQQSFKDKIIRLLAGCLQTAAQRAQHFTCQTYSTHEPFIFLSVCLVDSLRLHRSSIVGPTTSWAHGPAPGDSSPQPRNCKPRRPHPFRLSTCSDDRLFVRRTAFLCVCLVGGLGSKRRSFRKPWQMEKATI